MRLANKTALITGGNSGIGLATARLFVAEGAKVVITGRNQATLDAAAKELGPNALALVADATDIAATEAAIRQGGRKIRQVRHPVRQCRHRRRHAARRATTSRRSRRSSAPTSPACSSPCNRRCRYLNDNASIILNGSVISVLGIPGYSAYGAAKAGVRAMARIMASELSPRGIRVNVVAPGAIRTPIWGAAIATPEAEKAFEKRIALSTPLGRIGEPDHISKTVLFLASDDAAHVQGQELFVDGGATASPSGAPIYR